MVDLQFEGSNQRVEITATKPSLDWATELHQIQLLNLNLYQLAYAQP